MPDPSLPDALTSLGRDWSAATRLPVTFDISPKVPAVPSEVRADLLWIAREALHNIAAHAHAQQVLLILSYQDGQLRFTITDDGQGFSFEGGLTALWSDGRQGLAGMDERARLQGGTLEVRTWPENGTSITVRIPVALPAPPPPPPARRSRLPWVVAAAVVAGLIVVVALFLRPTAARPILTEPSLTPSPTTSPVTVPSPTPSVLPLLSAPPSPSASVSPAKPASGCTVEYVVRSQWNPGFVADVIITNTSAVPVEGWRLMWTFSAAQEVRNHWNATMTQTGASVTAINAGSNGRIEPKQSVKLGFEGVWSGGNPLPASFTLNGSPCALA
ncbi:cellulose binding domain-containing protein [Catelliglobosispora koreensis]|uniref:cellulose binding domain-containing protein n=1 Tax=Catelliglobosispora koreensis TaxID=129052 RepID=UPI0003747CA5|nr:cellulose binding domain-containing protein [Catelliglobosispora koreensis]